MAAEESAGYRDIPRQFEMVNDYNAQQESNVFYAFFYQATMIDVIFDFFKISTVTKNFVYKSGETS